MPSNILQDLLGKSWSHSQPKEHQFCHLTLLQEMIEEIRIWKEEYAEDEIDERANPILQHNPKFRTVIPDIKRFLRGLDAMGKYFAGLHDPKERNVVTSLVDALGEGDECRLEMPEKFFAAYSYWRNHHGKTSSVAPADVQRSMQALLTEVNRERKLTGVASEREELGVVLDLLLSGTNTPWEKCLAGPGGPLHSLTESVMIKFMLLVDRGVPGWWKFMTLADQPTQRRRVLLDNTLTALRDAIKCGGGGGLESIAADFTNTSGEVEQMAKNLYQMLVWLNTHMCSMQEEVGDCIVGPATLVNDPEVIEYLVVKLARFGVLADLCDYVETFSHEDLRKQFQRLDTKLTLEKAMVEAHSKAVLREMEQEPVFPEAVYCAHLSRVVRIARRKQELDNWLELCVTTADNLAEFHPCSSDRQALMHRPSSRGPPTVLSTAESAVSVETTVTVESTEEVESEWKKTAIHLAAQLAASRAEDEGAPAAVTEAEARSSDMELRDVLHYVSNMSAAEQQVKARAATQQTAECKAEASGWEGAPATLAAKLGALNAEAVKTKAEEAVEKAFAALSSKLEAALAEVAEGDSEETAMAPAEQRRTEAVEEAFAALSSKLAAALAEVAEGDSEETAMAPAEQRRTEVQLAKESAEAVGKEQQKECERSFMEKFQAQSAQREARRQEWECAFSEKLAVRKAQQTATQRAPEGHVEVNT